MICQSLCQGKKCAKMADVVVNSLSAWRLEEWAYSPEKYKCQFGFGGSE